MDVYIKGKIANRRLVLNPLKWEAAKKAAIAKMTKEGRDYVIIGNAVYYCV